MALTRITKGVIKPNENYDTHNINSTGIVTATKFVGPFDNINVSGAATFTGNVTIGGTLTYEDVTNVDSVGIITAQKGIHVGAGVSAVGVGTFGSLDISGDIDVDGHTNLDNVSVAGVSTFSGNVTIDAGANTTLDVVADSAGVAMVRTTGAHGDQTTAAFELRQSTSSQQGGGISYNGDGSPSFVSGETADNTTFYRILNGTRSEVFSYPYNSDTVTFNGTVVAPAFQGNLNGTVNTALQTNITRVGQLTQLSVSGTNNPVNFTHTGQNCVTFNRNSKTLSINANYAGSDQYSNIVMTSGMDIRWSLGGADKIVFKSAGHIEPQTDSQINLGADAKRFANVYADTLYGDGSNLTGITQTTINNNADNRVITGSGTANTLNAESTLTWSGVLLDLFQNTTAETGLKIRNSDGSCLIRTNDDKTFVDTDQLIIRSESSSEYLRIDSSGNILTSGNTQLIGSNTSDGSDNKAIMMNGGGAVSDSRGGYVLVHGNEHSSFPGVTRLHAGNVGTAYIAFNTAGSERLRIDSSGRVHIGSSNNTGSNTKFVVGFGNNLNTTALINTEDVDTNALTLSNWDGATTTNKVMIAFDNSGNGGFDIGMPAGSGDFAFQASGGERLRITSSGQLLIGTTTEGHAAADELTISNTTSGADMGITLRSATNGQGAIYFSDGTSGADEYRGIINYNHTNNFFSFFTNASEKLRILTNGHLTTQGNNTGNPVGMELRNNNTAAYSHAELSLTSQNATTSKIWCDVPNAGMRLQYNGGGTVKIDQTGNITTPTNGRIFIGDGGNSTNPMFANGSDTNTGVFFPAADNISITTGGAERLRIDNNGEIQCRGAADNKGFAVYLDNTRRVAELIEHSSDGELRLYTGEATPVLRSVITSYGSSYINAGGTNRFGIGTSSPSHFTHIKSNSEHQLYVESVDGGAGGSMKIYSPTYAYYCSQNTSREWRWGNYGGSVFNMRDNTGSANVFEIDTAGRIKVPAATFYGARATNSITSAQGVPSGDIMYIRGGAGTSNSAFDMFTIGNLGGNQSLHIEISFHHSGGGTHGSYMRADYGLNSYTNIDTFQNYAHNFGGGGGFSVTRPATGDFRVRYNGSSSFHQNFQLMARVWCGRNTPRNNMTLTDSSGGAHSFSCTSLLNF